MGRAAPLCFCSCCWRLLITRVTGFARWEQCDSPRLLHSVQVGAHPLNVKIDLGAAVVGTPDDCHPSWCGCLLTLPICAQVGSHHLNVKIDSIVSAMTSLFALITGRTPRFR